MWAAMYRACARAASALRYRISYVASDQSHPPAAPSAEFHGRHGCDRVGRILPSFAPPSRLWRNNGRRRSRKFLWRSTLDIGDMAINTPSNKYADTKQCYTQPGNGQGQNTGDLTACFHSLLVPTARVC